MEKESSKNNNKLNRNVCKETQTHRRIAKLIISGIISIRRNTTRQNFKSGNKREG